MIPIEQINPKGVLVNIVNNHDGQGDYISLTDIAKYKTDSPADLIKNWMRSRSTLEFLGLWETLNNSEFEQSVFENFLNESGANAFLMSPKKWIENTNAIGITSKSGRNGGTFANTDIAFEFASWVSPEFKLYIIKDYQRLKTDESNKLNLEWSINRALTKVNYKLHTDAIKENLIPPTLNHRQIGFTYASEADRLNIALFGMTAKEWREKNRNKRGNIRDFATYNQLAVLANLESYNSVLIKNEVEEHERTRLLNEMAKDQMTRLSNTKTFGNISKKFIN
ncbi:MAG: KilA-N domain-containing protein [Streptococcaceae bacterium]|jgi:hypothetical protein|nr:KilA-N domain-containing protein [Streptococcaceae bacterium]